MNQIELDTESNRIVLFSCELPITTVDCVLLIEICSLVLAHAVFTLQTKWLHVMLAKEQTRMSILHLIAVTSVGNKTKHTYTVQKK